MSTSDERENFAKNQLCSKHFIKVINFWTVLLERYSGPFLKWTKGEPWQMDPRTRSMMTMHKALHLRDDIENYMCQEKKEQE